MQNLIVSEDDFVYVQTEKTYILHLMERQADGAISQTSFSHSPLSVLMECVFQTREAAQSYASFYIA